MEPRQLDELAAYFYKFVILAYIKYRDTKFNGQMGNGDDKREALNAAVALYHFREHFPETYKEKWKENPISDNDYCLCGDLANLSKHNILEKKSRRIPLVANFENIEESLVVTRYEDDEGVYQHGEKVVFVKLSDGSERDIFEVLTNVLNMWQTELYKMGAIKKNDPFISKTKQPVTREKAKQVNLAITQGIQWEQNFRSQYYDYEKKTTVPIDLSGGKTIFTIYKPITYTVTLHNGKGEEISEIMCLSPEEDLVLKQLKDEAEKTKFITALAEKKGIFKNLLNNNQVHKEASISSIEFK